MRIDCQQSSVEALQLAPDLLIVDSTAELALEVGLGDLHITQSHADVMVPQQLHQGGKRDAQAEHLRAKGVA